MVATSERCLVSIKGSNASEAFSRAWETARPRCMCLTVVHTGAIAVVLCGGTYSIEDRPETLGLSGIGGWGSSLGAHRFHGRGGNSSRRRNK